MQRVGDELLAGAILALNQDVGLRIGDRRDQIEQLPHPTAATDDVVELIAIAQLALEGQVLGLEVGALDGAAQHRDDAVSVDRLLEEVRGACLDRLDRARNAALPADHEHFRPRLQRLQAADELGAADIWQHQIDQRGIRQPGRKQLLGLGAAGRDPGLVSGTGDDGGQPFGHIRFVVHHQHTSHPVGTHGLKESSG